jgi:23S rRNA (uracil1939-C5)-methyltransferase
MPEKNSIVNDRLTARVERLVHGGAALVRSGEGVVFVDGALPGELVEIGSIRAERGRRVGVLERVLEPSDERVTPPCEYFGSCGGCDWQHLAYEAQLSWKRAILQENFARIGSIELPDESIAIVSGEPYGYRSRVQLHRTTSGLPAFRQQRSHELVPVTSCAVASERINTLIARAGTADEPRLLTRDRTTLYDTGEDIVVAGRDREAVLDLNGRPFRFDPAGFAQSNRELLPALGAAITAATVAPAVLDLYAGAGLLARFAVEAAGVTHCTVVEPDAPTVRFAADNLAFWNGTLRVERITAEHAIKRRVLSPPTTLIVDPPRGGLSRRVREYILRSKAQRLVYLSCDAAALARDMGVLGVAYSIASVTIFDFYPQTAHIEALVVADRIPDYVPGRATEGGASA